MAGRFAPSPTGPLHLGSLLAATASYLDARARQETWRLRFDDLDRLRNVPGAEDTIKAALEAHSLTWDGPVIRQSERIDCYQQALSKLESSHLVFYCHCSRKELADHRIYPGTCRNQSRPRNGSATRIRVIDRVIEFHDRLQGTQRERLASSVGDFVIKRRDGVFAYQLATAVDDGCEEIDSVVRGADLLDNTCRQIYLMQSLGLTPPRYAHIPVLTHADGSKLSKQTFADPVNSADPRANLVRALAWLGLMPPTEAERLPPIELLDWAVDNWTLARIPGCATLSVAQPAGSNPA